MTTKQSKAKPVHDRQPATQRYVVQCRGRVEFGCTIHLTSYVNMHWRTCGAMGGQTLSPSRFHARQFETQDEALREMEAYRLAGYRACEWLHVAEVKAS